MTDTSVIEVGLAAIIVAAKLAGPFLVTALVVGFAISLFQSVTQIQEQTLSFVPKMVAISIAMLICGKWMLHEMTSFTVALFERIPTLLGG